MVKAKAKLQFSFSYDEFLLQGSQDSFALEAGGLEGARYSINKYPYNSVALMEFSFPNSNSFNISSGVVIGPHTVLTASHSMFAGSKTANDWDMYLRRSSDHFPNPPGTEGPIPGGSRIHYFNVGRDGTLTRGESEWDYAVINTQHKFSGWFGVQSEYNGGKVHMTGYPAYLDGRQQDVKGVVDRNNRYDVLDYENFNARPGNSGGPIWIDKKPGPGIEPYVVGVVSTTDWATLISGDVFRQIKKWVQADGYSFGRKADDDDGPGRSFGPGGDILDLRHERQVARDERFASELDFPLYTPDNIDAQFAL